jgi:hypothetical protein
MSPTAAGLVLAWLAIVLLALALAGLLRQLRDVQVALHLDRRTVPVPAAPELVRPAAGEQHCIVLLVAEHCGVCHDVLPDFAAAATGAPADVGFVLLAADPTEAERVAGQADQSRLRVVGDAVSYHRLNPGWLPAVVLVDGSGQVVAAEPVGSPPALRTAVTQFAGWRPAAPAPARQR